MVVQKVHSRCRGMWKDCFGKAGQTFIGEPKPGLGQGFPWKPQWVLRRACRGGTRAKAALAGASLDGV